MATDEEVETQRDVVVELRARLEEARSGGAKTQRELDNEIHLTNLQAEEQRLLAEIATAEAQENYMVRGAEAPLGTAKEQMILAAAQQKAVAEAISSDNRQAAPPAPVGPADAEVPVVQTVAEVDAKAAAKKKVEG